ncbi:MAG: dTMP kinase [Melioribacteraceae bacterium]|nr:dTMP kinase [Melioribacteraceae bacterium]
MFITFEGLDFCGKSTQAKLLKEYLEKNNKRVKILREPGGTNISEMIRDILLDTKNSEMFIETELLLFSSGRAQLVREVILPLLEENYFVISDRFHDSSIAYQGYGRGISIEAVTAIQNFAIQKALPDITFFIDLPVEEIENRKAKLETNSLDRIELSDTEFYNRVRNGYLKMCDEQERFKIIDGTNSIEKIHEEIINEINLLVNI